MNLLKALLNPSKKILFIFALFITPLLLYYLYVNAFDWFMGVKFYMKTMFILLAILYVLFFIADYFLKTALKKYILLSLALWAVICIIFFPAKKILENESEKKAEVIIKTIEQYKTSFGSYPDNLNDKYFSEFPLRSWVGSYYYYIKRTYGKNKLPGFMVYYYSFNGRRASYYSEKDVWEYGVHD